MSDEDWHFERDEDHYHSPLIWMFLPWALLILAGLYLVWQIVRWALGG